ncbi:Mediator complex, subunit Med31, partial [Dillenia turbinata]
VNKAPIETKNFSLSVDWLIVQREQIGKGNSVENVLIWRIRLGVAKQGESIGGLQQSIPIQSRAPDKSFKTFFQTPRPETPTFDLLSRRLRDGLQLMDSSKEVDDTRDSPPSPKNPYKDLDDGRQRFLLELEFIQCLVNPTYIHYLAQNRYFEDEAFIGYLKYLQYWQQLEYIKFIMYPHCLFFFELLQNANFCNAIAHPGNKELAYRQQFFLWKNYRNNRLKHILPRPLPELVAASPAPVPPLPPPPVPPTTVAVTAPAAALSPMPYGIPPGSILVKNDLRNSGVDRRKRNN